MTAVFVYYTFFFFDASEKQRLTAAAVPARINSVISTLSQPRLCDILPSNMPAQELPM